MNYLSVDGISKSYGIKTLFEGVTFGIEKGDKTALIAANGTGKTTLLRIVMGRESPDTGSVVFANDIKIGYLEQLPVFGPDLTIADVMSTAKTELAGIVARYEKALLRQGETDDKAAKTELENAIAAMDAAEAWSYEQRLTQLLSQFELNDLSSKIGELSGGQVKRLAIALTLLDDPDLLILDEPTNHLDVEMVEWLEKYLAQSNITLLMVTHDRYFLDNVCNKIFELYQGTMYVHNGNFDYYVQKSREREEVRRATAEKAEQQMKHELEWIRSTPQARTGKSKSRIDAFYDLKEKARLQRDDDNIQFGINMQRLGGKILEMHGVNKSLSGYRLLNDFEYVFKRGERIGLIGKNGVGKSTFLNLLTGTLQPDSGEIITGQTVTFGYYRQDGIKFDEKKTVLEAITDIAEVVHYGKDKVYGAAQLLAHFMFPYKMHRQPIALLSGGEKRRLYLLTVIVANPNFLILDEPTNDLDLLTLQKLEDFLQGYKGCLLVVSHDRHFLDNVVDQLFVFRGGGDVKGFMGNYTQYHEYLVEKERQEHREVAQQKREEKPQPKQREKKKRSFKEQREYEQLKIDLEQLEAEKKEIVEAMNNESDYVKMHDLATRLETVNALIDERELRWLELDEIEA